MTPKPWRPRGGSSIMESLVAMYGEPPYPPRKRERVWSGGTEVGTPDGWRRCIWCDATLTHANHRHNAGCPVDAKRRRDRWPVVWAAAMRELAEAQATLALLREEAAELGITIPEVTP